MSREPDTDPMTPLDSSDAYDASSSRANTDERVIGSLLDGLDAPQPVVRSRSGRRADGRDDGPIDIRAPGDRNAPTALLPHAVSRQQKRTLIALGVAAVFLVAAAVLLLTGPKPTEASTSPIVPMSISSNHQMPLMPSRAATVTATAAATITAVPTLAVSSLPTVPAPTAAAASATPTVSDRPTHTNGHSSTTSTGGNHPEIKEDPL
jgi:hypothetical protein